MIVNSKLLPFMGVLVGAALGVLLSSASMVPREWMLDWYYATHPVVAYNSEVVGRGVILCLSTCGVKSCKIAL